MTNRISRLLIAGAMAFATLGLSACGSGTPGAQAGDDGEGKVTLQFWQRKFVPVEDAWYKKTVDDYNKSQDKVHVKLTTIPADAWDQKMKAAQASGTAPDIYTLTINNVPMAVRLGQVVALSDYIADDVWADLTETAIADVTVNDAQYAFPMLYEPQTVLYYRKDLFEKAGLDPEKPPTSWAEMLEYGKKLTDEDTFGLLAAQTAGDFSWSTWGLQQNAAGHLPISEDWSTAEAEDPGYEQLLQFYQDLYDSKVLPKQALAGYGDPTPYGEGKAAMMTTGSWATSQLKEDYPEIAAKTGVAPMASIDGDQEKTTSALGSWKWVVDAKSEHPQEAADFIAATLGGDPQILVDYFKDTGFSKFPARTSVNEALAADPEAAKNEWAQTIAKQIMPWAITEPTYDYAISEAFGDAMERSLRGEDPAKSLATAQQEITTIIEKNDLAGKGNG